MQAITQMLMNNMGQRLTVELVNGMNHTIKTEFEKVQAQLQATEAERDELRERLGIKPDQVIDAEVN